MQPELITLWASLVLYVIAGCVAIVGAVLRRRPERAFQALAWSGFALQTLAIGMRWERLGHGPFITMHEILASNVWSLMLIFLLVYWRIRAIRPSAAVVMPIFFVMLGWLFLSDPRDGMLPSTYHTVWLYIHVAFAKIFFGSVLVAVGLAGVVLLRRFSSGWITFAAMPQDGPLDELAHRFLLLALIFDSLMLVSGAIWAQDAWGRYWSWDPLETWSFLTWLSLVLAVHVRVTWKPRPVVGSVMVVAVFLFGFLTFFGVPFISEAPHKGAV
jgi:ABC-type transport system involved in cytochrome c biogenesis permease subunit